MKKFIAIMISCSLALAAGAIAQQEDATPTPKKKNAQTAQEAQPPAKSQPGRSAAKRHAGKKTEEPADATSNGNAQAGRHKKNRNATEAAPEKADKPASPDTPAPTEANAQAQAPAGGSEANKANPGARKQNAKAKKPADVQKIKAQHANFHAQPKPQQVPAVTFSQSRQIRGSEQWQGEKYTVFRSYRPERHDQNFYRSHYSRVELIGGGYYYFNAGYWYPAWGYQPTAEYYVYDGPIYAGRQAEPPDRVIADVQASLQEMGYYKGEVDGLLGPLTREALTSYQTDNGLYTTATIDEPTLDSLGMG